MFEAHNEVVIKQQLKLVVVVSPGCVQSADMEELWPG